MKVIIKTGVEFDKALVRFKTKGEIKMELLN